MTVRMPLHFALVKQNPILRIALPSMVSNIAVPLLGLADTVIVGHLGAASLMAAIAVGSMVFSMMYGLFGFLRMGTGGLASQAYGANRPDEGFRVLMRSLALALGIAAGLLLLQDPIARFAFSLTEMSPEVQVVARQYFDVLVWGAPAVLATYSFNGWFLGMQNARQVMVVAIVQNAVNLPVSLALVWGCGMQVRGVAWGTLVAQYVALSVAIGILFVSYGKWLKRSYGAGWCRRSDVARFFRINRDIFLRTLCLIAVTVGFTAVGSEMGECTLAANALLMQFFLLFSYFMDGFAFAGEALGGRYYGARDWTALRKMVRSLFQWGITLSMLFTCVYLGAGDFLVSLLTDEQQVAETASGYLVYVAAVPMAGFSAFLLDGLFVGITTTRPMLVSMLWATLAFYVLAPCGPLTEGNAALWTAFLVYLAVRGGVEGICFFRWLQKMS